MAALSRLLILSVSVALGLGCSPDGGGDDDDDDDTEDPTPTIAQVASAPLKVTVQRPVSEAPVSGVLVIRGAALEEVVATDVNGEVTLPTGAQEDPITVAWRFIDTSVDPSRDVTVVNTWVGLGSAEALRVWWYDWEEQATRSDFVDGVATDFGPGQAGEGMCFKSLSPRGSYSFSEGYVAEEAFSFYLRASTDGQPLVFVTQADAEAIANEGCEAMPTRLGFDLDLSDDIQAAVDIEFDQTLAVEMAGIDPRMDTAYHDLQIVIPGRTDMWFTEPEVPLTAGATVLHAPSSLHAFPVGTRMRARAIAVGAAGSQLVALDQAAPEDLEVTFPPIPSYDADLLALESPVPEGQEVSVFPTDAAAAVRLYHRAYLSGSGGAARRYLYWNVVGLNGERSLPYVQLPTDLVSGLSQASVTSISVEALYGQTSEIRTWLLDQLAPRPMAFESASADLDATSARAATGARRAAAAHLKGAPGQR